MKDMISCGNNIITLVMLSWGGGIYGLGAILPKFYHIVHKTVLPCNDADIMISLLYDISMLCALSPLLEIPPHPSTWIQPGNPMSILGKP